MNYNKIEGVDKHPLIEAQEKSNQNGIEFRGFIGTEGKDFVLLFTDLEMSSSVEIPNDAILYWEKDPDGEVGKIRVFVSALKEVVEVNRQRVMARSSSLSVYGPSVTIDNSRLQPVLPEPQSFWSCVQKCEHAFARNSARIIQLDAQILGETNPERRDSLISQVETLKSQAKSALKFCLSGCPKPRYSLVSLGEIYSEICSRHLGVVNCTEPWEG